MGGAAAPDVADGATSIVEESPHLLELVGTALPWRVAHRPAAKVGVAARARALASRSPPTRPAIRRPSHIPRPRPPPRPPHAHPHWLTPPPGSPSTPPPPPPTP